MSRRVCGLIALILFGLLGATLPLVPEDAAAAAPPFDPQSLALPAHLFPPGSVVSGGIASNAVADRVDVLHARTQRSPGYQGLGRTGGYLETVQWTVRAGAGRPAHLITLRYLASIFDSAADANGAYTDGLDTLWEIGHPLAPNGPQLPVFSVTERDGHADAITLLRLGPVAAELVLRTAPGTPKQAAASALATLTRAARTATRLVGQAAAAIPLDAPADMPPARPAAYVAPLGTGPVVKSPSYLILTSHSSPVPTIADAGAFRAAAAGRLALRASRHPVLVVPGPLSRYVTTATENGAYWYDAAAIYSSAGAARTALDALAAQNSGYLWLVPFSWHTPATAPHLSQAAIVYSWWGQGETILMFQIDNAVTVLATTSADPGTQASTAESVASLVPTPLHAQGTAIVDAAGTPVKLMCLNWYGAEEGDFVVGGLDYRPYGGILQTIRGLRYNCIRLPFSNQLVETNPVVTQHLTANPNLVGLHALDIMDRVVQYAGALGLLVILDNHRSDAGWSAQPLWYTPAYPDAAFVHDWSTMAARYLASDVVVGADLRNEPHGQAAWGTGDPGTDWRLAAQRAGNAVLAANPNLLVIVEGIETYGNAPHYWWGGNLMGVATAPVQLQFADGTPARSQLVYSAHDYGPEMCGSGCPWFNATTSYDSLAQVWEQYWGYITTNATTAYAAPVWVGEFGTCDYAQSCVSDTTPGSQGQWFSGLTRYIAAKNAGWSYWAVNGTESTAPTRTYGAVDWYGVLKSDWTTTYPELVAVLLQLENGAPGSPGS